MQIQLTINPRFLLMRGVIPLALMGFALALVMVFNLLTARPSLQAQQGVLQLTAWQPDQDKRVLLGGEWLFFWDELLAYDQIEQQFNSHSEFIEFPGRWNGMSYQGRTLPAQGLATVALRLKLPDSHSRYTLKIPSLTSDYRLWINGKPLVRNEQLEDPVRSSHTKSKLRLIDFSAEQGEALIVFHLSNYRSKTGGIWEPLTLSAAAYGPSLDSFQVTRDVVTSFLLCVGAVALVFLAWREQRIAYIFLALWAAFMALRAGTVEERLFFQFFEIQDFEIQRKFEYGILYCTVPFFALYLGYRFPRYFPPQLHWATVIVMSALLLLVLITPATVYSQTVWLFQGLVVIYGFLWFGALVEFVQEEPLPGWSLLVGSLIFIATAVNDILFTNHLISGLNLSQIGALIFLLFGYFLYRWELQQAPAPVASSSSATGGDELEALLARYQRTPSTALQRQLIALSMQQALACWEQGGKDKLSLAEESGLWRITNDDGSLKTRTLDKYLRPELLPKNPRLKTVLGTLDFVLENSPESAESAQLRTMSQALRQVAPG